MRVFFLNGSPKLDGATGTMLAIAEKVAQEKGHECQKLCLGDLSLHFCTGCKACYKTGVCPQHDDVSKVMEAIEWADAVVIALPSYWGDMPGQMKTFIDRCTPYCNTNEGHSSISPGKAGYALALRAGRNPGECEHLIERIEHWLGHLNIPLKGSAYLCQADTVADVQAQKEKILPQCRTWF